MHGRTHSSLIPLARAGLVAACIGHAAACGGGEPDKTVEVPTVNDGGMDATADSDTGAADGGSDGATNRADAAQHSDSGSTGDAGLTSDGGPNGADSGLTTDAGPDAGFPAGDPTESCSLAIEHAELEQGVDISDEEGFAVALGITGFGVAFQADDCGAIGSLPVAATGAYLMPHLMFDDCSAIVRSVSLVHVDGGFRMAWVDNRSGSSELQTLLLSEAMGAPDPTMPTRVTTNQRRERRAAQWKLGSAHFLTWISSDPDGRNAQIEQLSTDTADEPHVLVAADSGYNPTRIALAQLGKQQGVLAFVSESSKPGAWLLPLDTAGTPVGSPTVLSPFVTTGNAIDVTTREVDGGAVIYSIDVGDNGHEVRFRRLDSQGAFLTDDIKLVPTPLQARDAGIARLGDGYVVGFRSLPTNGEARGEIRMMFITKEGNVQRDSFGGLISYPVADASPDGGRVSVRVSTDGQLLITFLDTAASGTKLRLVRKRLDCTL